MFFDILLNKVWSPITWTNGYRAKENYQQCEYAVLDFDNGLMTIDAMKKECEDYGLWYILATTKSHQIDKVSKSGKVEPACDRFRLVLKAKHSCPDRELYEYNMRLFAKYWPCDPSCVDGGRFFWPCKDIVAHSPGQKVPWLPFEDDYEHEHDRFQRAHEKLAAMGAAGVMPPWVEALLKGRSATAIGERHKTCYQLGATWAHLGWDIAHLQALVRTTNLADIGEYDYLRATQNGYDAAVGVVKKS